MTRNTPFEFVIACRLTSAVGTLLASEPPPALPLPFTHIRFLAFRTAKVSVKDLIAVRVNKESTTPRPAAHSTLESALRICHNGFVYLRHFLPAFSDQFQ